MASLSEYRAMLLINKNRLDDELELQPDVMERIATQVVIRNSRQIEAKEALAAVEAKLNDEMRETYDKITVDGIKSKVIRHKSRIEAFEELQKARSDYEQWDALLDAWRQKGYSLSKLCDLYAAQYFSKNSHTAAPSTPRRDAELDEGRAALRRASHQARSVDATSPRDRAAERALESAREVVGEPPSRSRRRVLT